jgi:SecD/SecF fusion protein
VDSLAEDAGKVKTTIEHLETGSFKMLGQDTVGASVGKDIQQSAIIASLLSLFGILVYVAFRYEFSFAVGAVLAVIHDVLMTIGIYYLSGRQFNATTVAAILTIIGFSTNDTIVIFDRIREDLKLGIRGTFKDVMNQALNQTLSRTIITSGTVFLATLSLFIFGGGEINDFAFTFLIGIITGTYSSIYIASAMVLWWHKGQRPTIGGGPLQPPQAQTTVTTPASSAHARG